MFWIMLNRLKRFSRRRWVLDVTLKKSLDTIQDKLVTIHTIPHWATLSMRPKRKRNLFLPTWLLRESRWRQFCAFKLWIKSIFGITGRKVKPRLPMSSYLFAEMRDWHWYPSDHFRLRPTLRKQLSRFFSSSLASSSLFWLLSSVIYFSPIQSKSFLI